MDIDHETSAILIKRITHSIHTFTQLGFTFTNNFLRPWRTLKGLSLLINLLLQLSLFRIQHLKLF